MKVQPPTREWKPYIPPKPLTDAAAKAHAYHAKPGYGDQHKTVNHDADVSVAS